MTRQAGPRDELRAEVSGQVSGIPAGRRGQRSGLGRFRAWPLPPARRTSPGACFAWAAASRACPFTSPLRALNVLALFLCSPLEPPRPRRDLPPARARPPRSPRRSAGALAPSPALPRGLRPPRVGTARGKQRAEAAGANARFFRAPLSFHGPLGGVVLPLAVRLREETTWELKDYKSQHPPRRGRERHGAGHFWCWVVGGGS